MKTVKLPIILMLLNTLCGAVYSQVTIGADIPPVKGALLDMKEKDANDGSDNATKGLNLPRVKLIDLSRLSGGPDGNPAITGVTDTEPDKTIHTGLTVYNVGNCPGVYVWTGTEWNRLNGSLCAPEAPLLPGTPPPASSFCGPSGNAVLSVSVSSGNTADWYDSPAEGSLLAGGTGTLDFTTPTINSTTLYYAEARNIATNLVSATRTEVTATMIPSPSLTLTGGTASQDITEGSSIADIVYTYADGATGATVEGLADTYYTIDTNTRTVTFHGAIPSTTSYTVTATAISPCTDITATGTISVLPVPPTNPTSTMLCNPLSGSATLGVTVGTGKTVDWYETPAGGTPCTGGTGTTTFATPAGATATTYYAEARDLLTGSLSPTRTRVDVLIINVNESFTPSPGQSTYYGSQPAVVSCSYKGSATIQWSIDNGTTWQNDTGSGKITVSSNSIYYVYCRLFYAGCGSGKEIYIRLNRQLTTIVAGASISSHYDYTFSITASTSGTINALEHACCSQNVKFYIGATSFSCSQLPKKVYAGQTINCAIKESHLVGGGTCDATTTGNGAQEMWRAAEIVWD